ncbi:hypothetical protein JTB14_033756 [Gonioctena quinquepunctata]|nr:hypothetical protein JTB14_033756 [Gonioctena quinquepunctata]
MIKSNEWSCLEDINDVDCCLDAFYEQIYSCIDQCVPKKAINESRKGHKFPVWFSHDLINKIKKKNRLHARIKRRRASDDQVIEFNDLRSSVKTQTKLEYIHYKKNIEQNINEDPQSFWNFFKSKTTSGIPKYMQYNGANFVTRRVLLKGTPVSLSLFMTPRH